MSVLRWLGIEPRAAHEPSDADALRGIIASLDSLPPERARFLAAFAFILSRVANADLHISPEETRMMEGLCQEHGGLSEAQAALVVEIAKAQHQLFAGTEDYLTTRRFREMSTREERRKLLECLFAVAGVDNAITGTEEEEIRRIASELHLEHRDYVDVRAAFRSQRTVMRRDPSERQ